MSDATTYGTVAKAAQPVWRAMLECVAEDHNWPSGQCIATSALLLPLLRAAGADCHLAIGTYGGEDHVWIEMEDGSIIDPTWGQFHAGSFEHPIGVWTNTDGYEGGRMKPHLEAIAMRESRVRGTGCMVALGSGTSIGGWRELQDA